MTIDIHSLLEKNPITRNMVKPKFGYKYLGAYNPLENQLLYNKNTGDIYTYYDKPKKIFVASSSNFFFKIIGDVFFVILRIF